MSTPSIEDLLAEATALKLEDQKLKQDIKQRNLRLKEIQKQLFEAQKKAYFENTKEGDIIYTIYKPYNYSPSRVLRREVISTRQTKQDFYVMSKHQNNKTPSTSQLTITGDQISLNGELVLHVGEPNANLETYLKVQSLIENPKTLSTELIKKILG